MKTFSFNSQVMRFESAKEFTEHFAPGACDLIFTNRFLYDDYLKEGAPDAHTLFCEEYGPGEPTDAMVTAMLKDIAGLPIRRIFGVGGGTVMDIAKLLCIKDASSADDIFDDNIPLVRDKELILVPTTCGTGCEFTCVSVIDRPALHSKIGKRIEANFADVAALVPEMLSKLPYNVFAYSSIDALIHAMEIYLAPTTNDFNRVFCMQAIRLILKNYALIAKEGPEARLAHMDEFLLASSFAGVALSNTACGAVHACAMHFGGEHHVTHGESNYCFLTSVFNKYAQVAPDGDIRDIVAVINDSLGINGSAAEAFDALLVLLGHIKPCHRLREYGVEEDRLPYYVDKVFETQQRLLINSYVHVTKEMLLDVYKMAY